MQLVLADGTERHIAVSDYGMTEDALKQGTTPFSARWIATVGDCWFSFHKWLKPGASILVQVG